MSEKSTGPAGCGRLPKSLAILAAIALLTGARAEAGLVISAPDLVRTPGSSGGFDILITNNEGPGGASFDVAAFTLELVLEGGAGLVFTPAPTIATVTGPYVFVDSAVAQGLVDFTLDSFPTMSFLASDIEFADALVRTIAPGETFGLARVFYEVAAGATGTWTLRIGPDTSLADIEGEPVAFTTRSGQLQVVPEPASYVSLVLGLGTLGLLRLRRRAGGSPPRS